MRFSLRHLMLLLALIGSLCAVLFSRAHRQRRAVELIVDLGGTITRVMVHENGTTTRVPMQMQEGASRWKRLYFGDQHYRIGNVNLRKTPLTDAELSRLATLGDTRLLNLGGTQVNGTGLAVLGSMPRLRELMLDGTAVSDASLAHLSGLMQLRVLNLDNTLIDGTGMSQLPSLASVKHLSLRNTRIHNESLAEFHQFRQLRVLHLDRTPIADAGLVHLRRCENLRTLTLENTQVSLEGLMQLGGLRHLEDLKALGLDLTAADLADLNGLRRKWEDSTRSREVSDPSLLASIVQAWSERQERVRSFWIHSAGSRTEGRTSSDITQEFAVNFQGHVRHAHGKSHPEGVSTITVFDGKKRKTLMMELDPCRQWATEGPRATDWAQERGLFPIMLALRPFPDLFTKTDLAVTADVERIDGQECVVMYHPHGKLWVDPSKDFAPLRYSHTWRGVTLSQVDLSLRYNDQVGWVPAAWTSSCFRRNGQIGSQVKLSVSTCSFNQPMADDSFELTYPPNTHVTDRLTGRQYVISVTGRRQVAGELGAKPDLPDQD